MLLHMTTYWCKQSINVLYVASTGSLLTVGTVKIEVALGVRDAIVPDCELNNVDGVSHERQGRKDESLSVHGELGSN
jgi:hypothetical protein